MDLTEKHLAKGVSTDPTNETTCPMKATMTVLVLTLLAGCAIGANAAKWWIMILVFNLNTAMKHQVLNLPGSPEGG
jgi:hypothetical protein